MHAEIGRAAGQVCALSAGNHGFGGGTAPVDAAASHEFVLDDGGFQAGVCQGGGYGAASLPGPDHDRIKDFHRVCLLGVHKDKKFLTVDWTLSQEAIIRKILIYIHYNIGSRTKFPYDLLHISIFPPQEFGMIAVSTIE
jgi:hypothetical protein